VRGLILKNFGFSAMIVNAHTVFVTTVHLLDNTLDGIDILQDNVTVTDSLIAGNDQVGVDILAGAGAELLRNTIGQGTRPNGHGVRVITPDADANNPTTIGGTTTADANKIFGNTLAEIVVEGEATESTIIQRNLIGTSDGVSAIGNAPERISVVDGADGTTLISNHIASASTATVSLGNASSTDARLQDNLIGMNAARTAPMGPSTTLGQVLSGGSDLTMVGNEIGGSGGPAAQISGGTNLVIRGNSFGTPLGFDRDVGDMTNGLTLGASSSGLLESNVIAYAIQDGVETHPTAAVWRIRGNRIFGNGLLAIDLASDGPNENPPPGGRQRWPVLSYQRWSNGYTLTGVLGAATPGNAYGIDLFTNAACDPSGFGEAEVLHEAFDVTASGSGEATFLREVIGSLAFSADTLRVAEKAGKATLTIARTPPPSIPGAFAATATDPNGKTSEVGRCVAATTVDRPVTINVTTAAGSAADGKDFTAVSQTVDFNDASTSKTVDIPLIDNNADEPDKAFTVTLSSPQGARLGATTKVTVTINDDEQPGGGGTGPGGGGANNPGTGPTGDANEEPDSDITRAPRRPRGGKLGIVRGEATDDDGEVKRVEIALSGTTGKGRAKRCIALQANGRLRRSKPSKAGRCAPRRYFAVTGTLSWRFTIVGKLPKGSYTLVSRAVDDKGRVESFASADDGNLVRIRVR
jgi:hypothetical protein